MSDAQLAGIFIYPVKGLRGIALSEAELLPRGLTHDRRWLVVTPEGRFLTQRELPAMARIGTRIDADQLVLDLPGATTQLVIDDAGSPMRVQIWRDEVDAVWPAAAADALLTDFLERPVRIVRFPEASTRPCKADVAPDASTAFADGFPLLVASEASLAEVNLALESTGSPAVPMNRFRPNLVLAGVPARAEDQHRWLRLDDGQRIELVSACERCIVTTTDQLTGERQGAEPIRTLRRIRPAPGSKAPWFGMNAVLRGGTSAQLRLGDRFVLEA